MSKKLTGNGLWESSRMMLPEHREQLLEQRRELKNMQSPYLMSRGWKNSLQSLTTLWPRNIR
ncbi:hypothetical protein P7H22_15005 [Paenibacillus larvae]|nr:hypothetical protein [Paenibacillus larvae]MDT2241397.1 hypothetical protein [Paenibacillus larvae]MDT2264771.1 hypothetical protein [Paenibacillus larvae]MDT2295271.1 hypothetical protein [Paenibacillus larvae]